MSLFIFILLSFCFLNSGLVYATDCFKPNPVEKDLKPNPVEKDLKEANKEVSVASNKQVPKPIPKHVLEQAQKSVWKIRDFVASGTGFFISPNQFVTNFHVVADLLKSNSDDFILNQKDSHKTLEVKKVKHLSAYSDLAILEIEGEVSDYLNLAKKDPQIKENLSSISYPKGEFKIVDKMHDISYENEFEYMYAVKDADYFGASGAPVLDRKGEVVGIAYANSKNHIYVVKIIHLKNLLKKDSPFFENPKDHLEYSIKEFRQMAEGGSMIAQYRLGFAYEEGRGVEKNLEEAAYWYKKAAEQGFVKAQNDLGILYLEGQGVEKNPKEAVRWLRKAAEQGYALAQYSLGGVYLNGEGVEKNLEEAARWLKKAAKQGYVETQYNLGIMYEKGWGVEKDLEEAAIWYREAAEQEYAPAQNNLGILYKNGWGVKKDLREAARWLKKAAKQGYAKAQYNLGIMHEKGWGVKKDLEEAAIWYKEAAEQGYAPAQYNLGVLYQKGQGVKKNLEEAAYWYKEAAEQEYEPAREMLEKYPELLEVQQIGF